MSADANKALMRQAVAAWNNGDRTAMAHLLDPTFVDHLGPGASRDAASYLAAFAATCAAFPDLHLAEEFLLADGDCVILRFIFTGTHHGAFLGIAPTGRRVTATGIGIVRFRDGRMVERWQNMDSVGLLQQFGATATAPTTPPQV